MASRTVPVHGVRSRRLKPRHLCEPGRFLALLLISGAVAACAESSVSDPEYPTSPSHEVLDAVAAIERDGPALAAQAVFPDGRTNTLAVAPGVVAHRTGVSPGFAQVQQAPQDAPVNELFFVQNPGDGTYTLSDGTPLFYTEHRPDGVTGIFQFFCIVSGTAFQLMEVTVDSIPHSRATDTGGHIDEEHTGQDSVGRWHSFDPPDGVVRDGIFEARYTTNEVSQDEEMRFHYTVDEAGSPCEGDKVVVTLRTGTRLLDKSSELAALTRIPDTQKLFFDATFSGHFDTYFLLPEAIEKLNRTAAAFAATSVPANAGSGTFDSLRVNSGSLIFGGLYAVCAAPTPYDAIACGGHQSHRIGTDVDLDWHLEDDDRDVLEDIIDTGVDGGGFRNCEVHNGNHVHCFGNARAYTQ